MHSCAAPCRKASPPRFPADPLIPDPMPNWDGRVHSQVWRRVAAPYPVQAQHEAGRHACSRAHEGNKRSKYLLPRPNPPKAHLHHKMRLWALWLCAACLAAELWIVHSKTHRYADQAEAKREALLLKQQVPDPSSRQKAALAALIGLQGMVGGGLRFCHPSGPGEAAF